MLMYVYVTYVRYIGGTSYFYDSFKISRTRRGTAHGAAARRCGGAAVRRRGGAAVREMSGADAFSAGRLDTRHFALRLLHFIQKTAHLSRLYLHDLL